MSSRLGKGDDQYAIADPAAKLTEQANQGHDAVFSLISYKLGANFEDLVLLGAGDGTGNTLNNVITGSSNDNLLDGAGGNDSLSGAGGNDTLSGGAGDDTLIRRRWAGSRRRRRGQRHLLLLPGRRCRCRRPHL